MLKNAKEAFNPKAKASQANAAFAMAGARRYAFAVVPV